LNAKKKKKKKEKKKKKKEIKITACAVLTSDLWIKNHAQTLLATHAGMELCLTKTI
jgi:hypothetical protein